MLDEAVGGGCWESGAAEGGAGPGCGDKGQGSGRDEAQRKGGGGRDPAQELRGHVPAACAHASCPDHRPGLRAQPGGQRWGHWQRDPRALQTRCPGRAGAEKLHILEARGTRGAHEWDPPGPGDRRQ